jgi:hypothetical protein
MTDLFAELSMEGLAMHVRYLMIASAALAIAAAAPAEPPKPESRVAQPPSRPAEVVLASADQVQPPQAAPQEQAQAPVPVKRPRAARVTTCRCADQTQR